MSNTSDVKVSNPKDAVGTAKVPASTVSQAVMIELHQYLGMPVNPMVQAELGLGMMEGALKYGRHNYRAVGVRASVYFDALFRHWGAWWLGQDIDPDSGLNHITKAIATLTVLRDSMLQENWVDDRPPKSKAKIVPGSDPMQIMGAWWEGQDLNSNGNANLVTVALAKLCNMREAMLLGTFTDPRLMKVPDENWVAGMNEKAAALLKKYPNPKQAFTELP
jgi:hypothetical protein